jgi:Cu/Ag efflux protein CusF
MKRLVLPLAAAVLLAAGSMALGATTTGTIKSIDTKAATVTLQSGEVFSVPSTMKLSGFKVGEKVKVTYSASNGKMEASEIAPAS